MILPRVLITTDIGNDPDDTQSLIHLMFYLNDIRLQGLIAAPKGGKKKDILKVIGKYKKDYHLFNTDSIYSDPEYLRAITKQGALESAPSKGYSKPTSGSKLIIDAALLPSTTPLYILTWGGLTDVAQALHDAPEIADKIFIYSIGTKNQETNLNAYNYVTKKTAVPMIIAEGTYRGMYVTGVNEPGRYGNVGFVKEVIKPAGALGKYFYKISEGVNVGAYSLKLGDTPSLLWVLNSDGDPTTASWGGRFRKISNNRFSDLQQSNLEIQGYKGAKTVANHRQEFLEDWETRIKNIYGT